MGGGGGGKIPWPGQLAPEGEDTLAWPACPPPQENLTQLHSVTFFFFK